MLEVQHTIHNFKEKVFFQVIDEGNDGKRLVVYDKNKALYFTEIFDSDTANRIEARVLKTLNIDFFLDAFYFE